MFDFTPKQEKTYILVKEGKNNGIETFIAPDIGRFNPAYKGVLKEFLKKTIEMIESGEVNDKYR